MRKFLYLLFFLTGSFIGNSVYADIYLPDIQTEHVFFRAEVISVNENKETENLNTYQIIEAKGLHAPFKEKIITAQQENIRGFWEVPDVHIGQEIILLYVPETIPPITIYTPYRLKKIIPFLLFFAILVLIFTKKRGLFSLLSLGFSLVILLFFVIPQISNGNNPLFISIIGAIIILFLSLLLTHGINKRTIIALLGSISTIGFSGIFGYIAIKYLDIVGNSTEEAFFLQLRNAGEIDLQGILLGAIIIGTVGILDDVTIVQSTTIKQLSETNPNLSKKQLYDKGILVGKEHILSMVNTLFLAYTALIIPLFLFYSFQGEVPIPLWVRLNSEEIIQEIVRAIVGSCTLILGIPFTTWLASLAYSQEKKL